MPDDRDIPQSWLLSYVDECAEISTKYKKGSRREQLALRRAQYTLDILKIWRDRSKTDAG